ncbi:YibE/F family protein, partial [Conexibacter sp. JD483]|uniref:YibE/F family protein n=2 Tax=unclassified Conexibacter TaxID=2627773 RepID=UPI0028701CEC
GGGAGSGGGAGAAGGGGAAGELPAGTPRYGFASVDRRGTILWLAIAFSLLVVLLARWRGVLAIVGFAVSLLLVTQFLVPAVGAGAPGFAVAIVGSFAVMFVTVGLTYGLSATSLAAILGIAASLMAAAALGSVAVHAARLDGRANEAAQALTVLGGGISLQGVVLAGLVFSALGVLADQAVTQASAVLALRRANPSMSGRELYLHALSVGRDHLVATTHTLVLVYVGATFPLLLVLNAGGVDGTDALNREDLAEPIIATLVGAIALLISVPLVTALTALIATPAPAGALPADAHHHHHH